MSALGIASDADACETHTDADYMAREITQTEANEGLTLAAEILAFIVQAQGLILP